MHGFTEEMTLRLFCEHYQNVLETPDGTSHLNIRSFMKNGWEGVRFDGETLRPKSENAEGRESIKFKYERTMKDTSDVDRCTSSAMIHTRYVFTFLFLATSLSVCIFARRTLLLLLLLLQPPATSKTLLLSSRPLLLYYVYPLLFSSVSTSNSIHVLDIRHLRAASPTPASSFASPAYTRPLFPCTVLPMARTI